MGAYSTYDVVLLPTFVQVEAWRKARALEGGLFGAVATTFNAWIADLWELYGDGRTLVNSTQRAVAMIAAFSQIGGRADAPAPSEGDGLADAASLTLSPGIPALAARCESRAAGIAQFDAAVEAAGRGEVPPGLDGREALFLSGIARYRQLLGALGLVELGEAAKLLAQSSAEVFPRPVSVLVEEAPPLDWRMTGFFEACPQLSVEVRPAPGGEGVVRLPDGVRPRFAFPSGRYAAPGLVADVIREAVDAGAERVVVAGAKPLALYKQLEPALARDGIVAGVQAQARFAATDFGKAYLLVNRLMLDDGWNPATLADILHSPFSGIGTGRARAYDAQLRADRLAARDACLAQLRALHPEMAPLLGLASGDGRAAALDAAEELARTLPHRSPAWRSEQLAAIAAARLVAGVASELGVDARNVDAVLDATMVTVSYLGATGGAPVAPHVLVTTQGAAATLGRGSCDVLLLADLTADCYPLADADDAAATLFAKLGLEPADDALARARRTFRALQQLPTRDFVCMRPLNDADGNPAYPCAMLEEFLDAYRDADAPKGDAGEALERGEELLFANARAAAPDAVQAVGSLVGADAGHALPPDVARSVLTARKLPDGGLLERSPSPSQVELYLECPRKWFVQRRLGIERLEEGFGALEKGSFAHAVLERFYRRFAEEVAPKVTLENLSRAREMIRQVADQVERDMEAAKPGSGRLVAATRLEKREIGQLKAQLADYLDFEAQLLPGFHPAYLEYEFDAGHAARYGGCNMVGTVDRIDVDGQGRAVIVDYKGSVGPEHGIGGKDALHPGKVQARIYAQMARRELGLDVVGAVYVSYGKRRQVAGAADSRVLESAHLPGAKGEDIWCGLASALSADEAVAGGALFTDYDFASMLDATEDVVADAVCRMERGDIAPRPSSPAACRYCPVAACPKKGA